MLEAIDVFNYNELLVYTGLIISPYYLVYYIDYLISRNYFFKSRI